MAVQPVDIHDRAAQAYGLHNLFPKENYKKDRKIVAHYLILYKNHKALVEWLDKYPGYLSEKATQFLLTPLHLCAIVVAVKSAEYLLTRGAHIHEFDSRKWTPLHHAALHINNTEVLDLLLKIDKERGCLAAPLKNNNNDTYVDLRQWAFSQQKRDPDAMVFNYCNPSKEIAGGIGSHFQEMTGAQFVSQMHVDPSFFINERKYPTKISDEARDITTSVADPYFSFLQTSPSLYLEKTEAPGFGVFSTSLIPENSDAIEHLGIEDLPILILLKLIKRHYRATR